jgi:hypothetical protein
VTVPGIEAALRELAARGVEVSAIPAHVTGR